MARNLELKQVGIWKQSFGIFLYIQIFTNILLCFFFYILYNSQEFGTKIGRYLEVNHKQNSLKDQVKIKLKDQKFFTKES